MNERNFNEKRHRLDSAIINLKIRNYFKTRPKFTSLFLFVGLMILKLNFLIEVVNVLQIFVNEDSLSRPRYKVFPEAANARYGYLKHLHAVLERFGYEKSSDKWDLFWSHKFINFNTSTFKQLLAHQRVNQVPGTSVMKLKKKLVRLKSKYIPKSFRLPREKEQFFKFATENNNSLFLQKNINHRGIRLLKVRDVHKLSKNFFIQEYIQKPFLVDGHKFDIGVYVVITSMNPLRAYWYKGDVGFRYCRTKYYPFNPTIRDKYVVGNNYLPTWELPSLAESYSAHGHGMKDSFDIYIKSKGIDPWLIWTKIQKAISEIFILNADRIARSLNAFPSQDFFFELVRLDLIIDESLKVHLLEVNLSPNLSSANLPANGLLFEQLLYNLFSLTGISYMAKIQGTLSETSEFENIVSSQKHIAVLGEKCRTLCSNNCKASLICRLCKPCLDEKLKKSLLKAHTEFMHRGDFRRVFPPPRQIISLRKLSLTARLQYVWYKEKCKQDVTWCA